MAPFTSPRLSTYCIGFPGCASVMVAISSWSRIIFTYVMAERSCPSNVFVGFVHDRVAFVAPLASATTSKLSRAAGVPLADAENGM